MIMILPLKILLIVVTACIGWFLAALQYKPKWKDGRTILGQRGRRILFLILPFSLCLSVILTYAEHSSMINSQNLAHEERDDIKNMLKPFVKQATSQFPNLSEKEALHKLAESIKALNTRLSKTEIDLKRNKADNLAGSAYEAEQRKDHAYAVSLYMDALLTMLEIPSLEGVQLMARQIRINLMGAKRLKQEFLESTQKNLDNVIQELEKYSGLWRIKKTIDDLKFTRKELF